jgi:hypothetical protein
VAVALVLWASLGLLSGPAAVAGASQAELVWVASADSGPVQAYAATSSGSVSPLRSIDDPQLPDTVWDPWGVAVGPSGRVYVQSFLSDATSFVFGPGAHGHAAPKAAFVADAPDTRSIAVDSRGYEYVASGESAAVISVAPRRASGQPSDLYRVSPVRTITTDEQGFEPWPDTLATDARGQLVAAVVRSSNNSIEFFSGGPTGPSTPARDISGTATGLGDCASIDVCDHVNVAVASLTADTVVGVSEGTATHISVWAPGATGDTAPLVTIQGSLTGLDGRVITGLAVSARTGDIYAMVKPSQFSGPGAIEVFAPTASGNSAPVRVFTDPANSFASATGIAVH